MEPFEGSEVVTPAVERIASESCPTSGLLETPLDAVEGVPRAALRQGTIRIDGRLEEPDTLFEVTKEFTALYRSPSHMFFAVPPGGLEPVFGRPPALLGSWEPIGRASRLELEIVYGRHTGGDPVAAGVAPPPDDDRQVLAVGCTHATELSYVGFHEHDAARAFVLSALGFCATEVGRLLSVPTDRAGELVEQGWRTMRRIKWVDTVSDHLLQGLDPHEPALRAREGRRYVDPDSGDEATFVGAEERDGRVVCRLRDGDGEETTLPFASFTRLAPAEDAAGDGSGERTGAGKRRAPDEWGSTTHGRRSSSAVGPSGRGRRRPPASNAAGATDADGTIPRRSLKKSEAAREDAPDDDDPGDGPERAADGADTDDGDATTGDTGTTGEAGDGRSRAGTSTGRWSRLDDVDRS